MTTILSVDNSPVNFQLAGSTLEPFGYKIVAASNVREALALGADKFIGRPIGPQALLRAIEECLK